MGSSLCRNYSIERDSPYMGKTFQVQDMRRWAALIRDLKGEKSRLVAFIILFVKFLEQTSFGMYLYVKKVVIELIWTVFNIVLHVFI